MKISDGIRRWFDKIPLSRDGTEKPGKMPEGYFTSALAKEMIQNATAPDDLWTDRLVFEDEPVEIHLPKKLKVQWLEVRGCENFRALPEELFAQNVYVHECRSFDTVPARAFASKMTFENCEALRNILGRASTVDVRACVNFALAGPFHCENLFLTGCGTEQLPAGVRAQSVLDLSRSRWLREIGEQDLNVLNLSGCERLEFLPGYLRAHRLTLTGCTGLKWQDWADVHVGTLELQDCTQIRRIPEWLTAEFVDVANTGLREMPEHLKDASMLWRGVDVDERVAFRPESIEAKEILREANSERRRVMLERVGWERFFAEVKPKVIHRDRDPGGERLLMEFRFEGEREAVVVLAVQCPSTGRKYFIRVPPERRTCHVAAAWIAGFDDGSEYEPVVET